MRYFFVERSKIEGNTARITGSDAGHIKNVLRLKPGSMIGLFDGQGWVYEARIIDLPSGSVNVAIVKQFLSQAESPVHITVAQAFLQDRKMDRQVRQLTELGISRWLPFIAARSVSRPDKKRISARTKRWEKIAKEAIKQCRRGRIPEIGATVSFAELLTDTEKDDLNLIFWEKETRPIDAEMLTDSHRSIENIFLMVGPEGGFTPEEVDRARASGFLTVSMGPRILRAETASIAACTLIQYLLGDMGPPNAS